jgi:hypothetical protein
MHDVKSKVTAVHFYKDNIAIGTQCGSIYVVDAESNLKYQKSNMSGGKITGIA